MEIRVNLDSDFEILYESIHGRTRGPGLHFTVPFNTERRRTDLETFQLNRIGSVRRRDEPEVKITYVGSGWIKQSSNIQSSSTVVTRSAQPSSAFATRSQQSSDLFARSHQPSSSAVGTRSHQPSSSAVGTRSPQPSSSAVVPGPTIPSVVICPVCLQLAEEISAANYELLAPHCGHIICSNCMIGIINHDSLCPKCRKRIILNNVRRIYL